MNIQLVSDLHLCWGDLVLPGGDLLIMAGDVFEASDWTKVPAVSKVYDRFCDQELTKYHTVLYVFGNHEHYGSEYSKTRTTIQGHMPSNVVILENEHMDLDGVRFWGATLWTDMNRSNPVTMNLAQGAMNDYHHIKHTHRVVQSTGHSYWTSRFQPQDTVNSHKTSLQSLKSSLQTNIPHFVVTHHAPSQGSVHPRYVGDPINHCYYSNLEEFILDHPQIKHWVHGHTHHPFHYNVGSTQVHCHPRGYYGVDTDEYQPLQIE
jgi:hypothetical protein